ncbi:MAG: NADH-quinone oxidoreductase subunit L, partial [Alphaproteobacteria bacterium]|nr:NADH-quinone oxidoreductase subunit L [Alphaproteobacteria bacterium]
GIWRLIPTTYVMMWIGSLALAGIPFFAGYYSKDIILEAAFADHSWFGTFAYWMGIAAAVMTAFYSWRLLFMTFHGKPRASKKVMGHVHESPQVMLGPLVVLATGALFAGALFYEPFVGGLHHKPEIVGHELEMERDVEAPAMEDHWMHEAVNRRVFWGDSLFVLKQNDSIEAAHHVPEWVKLLPFGAGVLGIVLSWLFYIRYTHLPGAMVRWFRPLHSLFYNKWYFDQIYASLIVRLVLNLGRLFWKKGDGAFINRMGPDGIALFSSRFGALLSRFQTGYVYHYAFAMLVGLVLFVGWIMWGGLS